MTDKELLIKLVEDLSEFNIDHLNLMRDMDLSQEQIVRWRQNRDKLNKVEDDFNNFY